MRSSSGTRASELPLPVRGSERIRRWRRWRQRGELACELVAHLAASPRRARDGRLPSTATTTCPTRRCTPGGSAAALRSTSCRTAASSSSRFRYLAGGRSGRSSRASAAIAAGSSPEMRSGAAGGRDRSSRRVTLVSRGSGRPTRWEVVAFVCRPDRRQRRHGRFGTEGGLFAGGSACPSVVCGPGSMAQGHRPDEFVTEARGRAVRRDAGGAGRAAGGGHRAIRRRGRRSAGPRAGRGRG